MARSRDDSMDEIEETDNAGELIFPMLESGTDEAKLHIRNNPKDKLQRTQVIQRTGHGVDIRCNLIDIIHGAMSEDSEYWATILVFLFRFDPQKRSRRITKATIELIFDSDSVGSEMPIVDAISFDGHYSFLPTIQSETTTTGAEGGIGASYGIDLQASMKWEKQISREISDAASISGGKLVISSIPPDRKAKWTLLENDTIKAGIPASVQVAVRIKKRDEAIFTCLPVLKCTADKWTTLQDFFGGLPVDDPVFLDPKKKPTNKLMIYSTEELGSIDLDQLSDVTATTMLLEALKERK
ncbi:hypothetical protein H9Q74_013687 [Fusarium xylarioides]|nr:hypothetical protein H9Q71_013691 [Fusarium xylarioides]KAG5811158.1 hypothetical protein H9Q74_013687 [Fusarium xylarioides]